jgi:hypothetical protein
VVIGVLNDDLKKLLLLSVQYIDSCREAAKPMKMEEIKGFMAKVSQNREISDTLRSMFWIAVADTFGNKATGKNLALRDGWTIVEPEDGKDHSTEESILDEILDGIFGHSIVVMSGSGMSDFSEIFGGKRPH